jgi:hypothetical protein
VLPEIPESANVAEKKILDHMSLLMEHLAFEEGTLELAMKSFINADMTVDGELRVGRLLDHWRTEEGIPELMEILSRLLRGIGTLKPGSEGGAYWISIGVRFGPQTDAEMGDLAEMYKRYRGMFQVASYPLDASKPGGVQNAIVAFGSIVRSLMEKKGLPPAVVFVRYTWMPDGSRPGRFEGEKGGGK